jgi:predicted metal-dependent peptidase
MTIKGLGGTSLNPAIEFIKNDKKLNKFNTLILTDGYTDTLNFDGIFGNVLIISNNIKCPIKNDNNKIKQIVIKNER